MPDDLNKEIELALHDLENIKVRLRNIIEKPAMPVSQPIVDTVEKNIYFVTGDATEPIDGVFGIIKPTKIIAHVVNNVGAWGAGFVLAISKKWPEVEKYYRQYYKNYTLGGVQWLDLSAIKKEYFALGITIANMFAQHGTLSKSNAHPLHYAHLRYCLNSVFSYAQTYNVSVHMPKIGSGLGGGDWDKILEIIRVEAKKYPEVPIYIYTLPESPSYQDREFWVGCNI